MRIWALLLSLALAGCAAAGLRGPAAPEDADEAVRGLEDQLYRDEAELLQGLEFVPTPDCQRLCRLGENICLLAGKICDIAARHPDRDDIMLRCRDGRTACDSARSRLSGGCDCDRSFHKDNLYDYNLRQWPLFPPSVNLFWVARGQSQPLRRRPCRPRGRFLLVRQSMKLP